MAFLVGRSLVDDRTMRRVFLLLIGLSILAASYGLWQTFVRFPSWDQTWITERGYTALSVGGVIRSFASFSAASEYGIFLGVGIICTAAFARRPSRSVLALAVIALLATGLWFESSRGIVVLAIASLAVMVAARRGWRGPKAATITILALVALPFAIGHLAPARFGSDAGGALAAHQVQGLADPFGSQSTLPGHFGEMMRGITGAIKQPMGVGVGSVTNAAAKFGGTSGGTEVDIGNVGVAAGLPGLLAFLAVAGFGLTRLYRLAASRRDAIAVAALGVAVVMGLQWLTSGNYAVIFLPWLVLGWADRAEAGPGQPEPS
jgi:hypothetical protein